MERPSPAPPEKRSRASSTRKNGSKMVLSADSGTPGPWSRTRITAASPSPAGTEVELSLVPAGEGKAAVIRVRDHGPGVPEPARKTIFEPFFRVAEARDRFSGGAGLGLSITDRVIRAHGGTVNAENQPEGGLVIELTLPVDGPSPQVP